VRNSDSCPCLGTRRRMGMSGAGQGTTGNRAHGKPPAPWHHEEIAPLTGKNAGARLLDACD
jgi:hypothetical protein